MSLSTFVFDTSDMAFHCTRCGVKHVPTEPIMLAMLVSVCNQPCSDLPVSTQTFIDAHGSCLPLLSEEAEPAGEGV